MIASRIDRLSVESSNLDKEWLFDWIIEWFIELVI